MLEAEEEELQRLRARVGTTVAGKWRLDALIGAGGMAAVYAATHRVGHRVAIKILHPESAVSREARARFEQEALAAARLGHPAAVQVLDVDVTEQGEPVLVMELLEGESLRQRVARLGGMPVPELLGIIDTLLEVLKAAHDAGIVHRDIKPDNLFLTRDGRLKVLDFGIARMRQGGSGLRTRTGAVLGTTSYMAPEQILGRDVDGRADLYAVGATMFTILTNRRIHDALTEGELLVKMSTLPAPPLASVAPGVDPRVARIVDRALAFQVEHRYPDAQTMLEDVRAARRGEKPPRAAAEMASQDERTRPLGRALPPGPPAGAPLPGAGAPAMAAPAMAAPAMAAPAMAAPAMAAPGAPWPGHAPESAAPGAPWPGHAPASAAPGAPWAGHAPASAAPGAPWAGHAPASAAPGAPWPGHAPASAAPGAPWPGHAPASTARPRAPGSRQLALLLGVAALLFCVGVGAVLLLWPSGDGDAAATVSLKDIPQGASSLVPAADPAGCKPGLPCTCPGGGPGKPDERCLLTCGEAPGCKPSCTDRTVCESRCAGDCQASCARSTVCDTRCGDRCSIDCRNAETCQATCGAGCSYTCEDVASCGPVVGDGSVVRCNRVGRCQVICTGACAVSCSRTGSCQVECQGQGRATRCRDGRMACGQGCALPR
ncbi:serine/threonine-protein kinase [Sorangium cellulosum]|nr:serine/threonine-protein kinase [Sorangium cellulosum]